MLMLAWLILDMMVTPLALWAGWSIGKCLWPHKVITLPTMVQPRKANTALVILPVMADRSACTISVRALPSDECLTVRQVKVR